MEAVLEKINSEEGCSLEEGIALAGIVIVNHEWAMRRQISAVYSNKIKRLGGTGSKKTFFYVPHREFGKKKMVHVHHLYLSESQREYAMDEIKKQMERLGKSYGNISPKMRVLSDQWTVLSNHVFDFVKEGAA